MDATALQAEVRRIFPMERWSIYEALLEKNQAGPWAEPEHAP
jgi:hypothetical protein